MFYHGARAVKTNRLGLGSDPAQLHFVTGVVVKVMVPSWVPIMIRPLIFRVPKKGP